MGINAATLRKAKELEEIQKREFLTKRAAEIRQNLISFVEPQKVDEPQTLFDKILRKLGLQRIR